MDHFFHYGVDVKFRIMDLNNVLKVDRYPLLEVEDLFSMLDGNSLPSLINLKHI